MNQIIYELTYWFDFSMRMVVNHPFISAIAVLVAFLSYQVLSAMKLIGGIISLVLGLVTAIFLGLLMF
jgi:hypothetical protein